MDVSRIRFLDELRVPFSFKLGGIEVGGISGMTYNPLEDVYYALIDGGSRPVAAFNTLRLGVDEIGWNSIEIVGRTAILVSLALFTLGWCAMI